MRSLATVPREISDEIINFCHSINPQSTVNFIDSIPLKGSTIGNCFDNVNQSKNNDEVSTLGWIIWQTSSHLLQAEFHNVIKSKNGTLRCVTPYKRDYKRILFLPDATMQYENRRVHTIYKAISDIVETKIFIEALESLSEIEIYMSDSSVCDYFNNPENVEKRNSLQTTMQDIENAIELFESIVLKDTTRNSECICGSGKKFKKCCG
ncbi:MAG: SEC-C metal-binding domain-containing protein [Sulfurimonas sp.]|nr:SEC-C metal-binding domain-containing protein [Sulfurimonas sp.]